MLLLLVAAVFAQNITVPVYNGEYSQYKPVVGLTTTQAITVTKNTYQILSTTSELTTWSMPTRQQSVHCQKNATGISFIISQPPLTAEGHYKVFVGNNTIMDINVEIKPISKQEYNNTINLPVGVALGISAFVGCMVWLYLYYRNREKNLRDMRVNHPELMGRKN